MEEIWRAGAAEAGVVEVDESPDELSGLIRPAGRGRPPLPDGSAVAVCALEHARGDGRGDRAPRRRRDDARRGGRAGGTHSNAPDGQKRLTDSNTPDGQTREQQTRAADSDEPPPVRPQESTVGVPGHARDSQHPQQRAQPSGLDQIRIGAGAPASRAGFRSRPDR